MPSKLAAAGLFAVALLHAQQLTILVSNSYHEFTQPSTMLKHLYAALKPNGRLVALELYSESHKNDSRADQVKRHDISPDILERELSAGGFVIKQRIDAVPLLPTDVAVCSWLRNNH